MSSGRSFGFEVCARLPEPTVFRHGAELLAKDVRLLGESLNGHTSAEAFQQVTAAFLKQALQDKYLNTIAARGGQRSTHVFFTGSVSS